MFERFTKEARQVVISAQKEAKRPPSRDDGAASASSSPG